MINQGRLVCYARLFALDQVREVVVLFQSLACLGQNGVKPFPQRPILDALDFAHQLDPAVPDF